MNTKQALQQQLKILRKELNLNQKDFASKLDCTQATIANMESGARAVSQPILQKIKEVYNIDLVSEVYKNQTEEKENNNIVKIPFYSAVKAAAGSGSEIPNYPEQESMTFDRRWLKTILGVNEKNVALINVEGDSMFPLINDGDLLMFDFTVKDVVNNKVFIIEDEDKLRVKRLKQDFNGDIYLISDNKQYPPEKVTHSLNIVGKVVWNGSKENV